MRCEITDGQLEDTKFVLVIHEEQRLCPARFHHALARHFCLSKDHQNKCCGFSG